MSHNQEHAAGKRRGSSIDEGQDLASHDIGPMSPKPSSLSEEPDSRILRGYCGVKELSNPGPLYIELKAHAEEEEMLEDEQRKSKLTTDITKDNPVLGQPRS